MTILKELSTLNIGPCGCGNWFTFETTSLLCKCNSPYSALLTKLSDYCVHFAFETRHCLSQVDEKRNRQVEDDVD